MTRHQDAEHARANEVIGCYFIEGAHYRKQDLLRARMRFTADSSESQVPANGHATNIDTVIRALCSYQFASEGSASSTSALELHGYQGEPYYTFQFVGVLVVHDYVFYVFPKFVRSNYGANSKFIESSKKARDFMRLVINVCDKYRMRIGSGTDDTGFSTRASKNATNTAELYRALLSDYVHDGAYRSRTRVWAHDGNGEIDWARTLNRTTPYFTQQGAPLYADYWTCERAVDEEALVRRIQLAWVAYAAQQFESAELLEDVLGFPHALCSVSREAPSDIGTLSFIRTVLIRARNHEFSTRNCSLINILLLLVDSNEQRRLNSRHAVTHLGTAPFHTVWEDICRALFSDTDLDSIREQSKPIWHMDGIADESDAEVAAEHNQLIPDVVCTVSEPVGTVIIDAKYYMPERNAHAISGQPGAYDVVKEYFYQLIADIALQDSGPVLANAFMFPAPYIMENTIPEPTCAIQGSVRFDALGHYELRRSDETSDERGHFLPIVCARLNPLRAFQAYVDSDADDSFDRSKILSKLIQRSKQ